MLGAFYGGPEGPSDFSFPIPNFSFLVPRFTLFRISRTLIVARLPYFSCNLQFEKNVQLPCS